MVVAARSQGLHVGAGLLRGGDVTAWPLQRRQMATWRHARPGATWQVASAPLDAALVRTHGSLRSQLVALRQR
jgi:hypothetical protein